MNWYLKVLKKYADFSGRARRKEYWMFVLFNIIFMITAIILDNILGIAIKGIGYGPLYGLYGLVLFIPSLAVSIRRLHDVGKSGWMILITFIPLIGGIWLLAIMLTDSNSEENKYGKNPKGIQTGSFTEEEFTGDILIFIVVVWVFINRAIGSFMPKVIDDNFYLTIIFNFFGLIWALLPLSLAFAVKNKLKKIILFILGGIYLLVGLYEILIQFIK